jgi:hypothetical protein
MCHLPLNKKKKEKLHTALHIYLNTHTQPEVLSQVFARHIYRFFNPIKIILVFGIVKATLASGNVTLVLAFITTFSIIV